MPPACTKRAQDLNIARKRRIGSPAPPGGHGGIF
jgi:hypothetical protein